MGEIIGGILTTLVIVAVLTTAAWSRYGGTIRAIWHAIIGREPD